MDQINDTGITHDYELQLDATVGGRRERLSLTVNSDLTRQFTPGVHAGPERREQLEAIHDAAGFPIVFFLDEQRADLHVVYRDPKYVAGQPEWKRASVIERLLDEHFPGRTDLRIPAYDVGQDGAGRLELLVEVFDPRSNQSSVFVSGPIANHVDHNWLPALRSFKPRGSLDGETVHVLVGSAAVLDDPRHGGLAVVSLRRDGELRHHHWVPQGFDPKRPEPHWREFTLLTNAGQLVALVPGKSLDGYGVYALTEQSGQQVLSFTCLIDVDGELVNDRIELQLPPGRTTSLSSALANAEGHTDLYLGGSGLWCHKAERVRGTASEPPIRLTRPGELDAVHELISRADAQNVTLLALDERGALHRLVRPVELDALERLWDDGSTYRSPVPIYSDLRDVALVRGRTGCGESLLISDKADRLLRLEHADSGWNAKNIPVPARVGLNEIDCYTIQITIDRANGRPLVSEQDHAFVPPRFELGCDESVELQVNGRHLRIGPDRPAVVHPDLQGKITIVSQVESPAAPPIELSSPYFGETLEFNPSRKLERKLHSYRSAQDMKDDLVDAKGRSVIQRPGNLDAAFEATAQLQGINNQLRAAAGLSPEPVADAAAATSWTLSIVDGVASFHAGEGPEDEWFWSALESLAADAFRWIGARVHDTLAIIVKAVDGAWHFAVKIGEQAFRFVIDGATKLFEAFKVVLSNVLGVLFDAIVKWLGFLFDWDDVVTTYKVFSNVAFQSFEHAKAKLAALRPIARGKLDELEALIRDAIARVPEHEQLGRLNLLDERQNSRQHEDERTRAASARARKTPAGNFGAHQLQISGMLSVDPSSGAISMPALAIDADRLCERFIAGLPADVRESLSEHERSILAWFQRLWAKVQSFCRVIADLVSGKSVTAKQILDSAAEFIYLLIDAARGVLDVGFNVLEGAVASFALLLFDELDIPFLAALFRRIVGADTPRFGLNAVNATLLLMAIPATFTFKLLSNRAPFHEHGRSWTGRLDQMNHEELFAAFRAGGLQRRTYTDYRHLSQLMSSGLTGIENGAAAIAALAETGVPALLNSPIVLSRIACTIPIGEFALAKYGGWLANWLALATNVFGVISPGPSGQVSSVLKIVLYLVFSGGVPLVSFVLTFAKINSESFGEPNRRANYHIDNGWILFDSLVTGLGRIVINCGALWKEPESKAAIVAVGSVLAAVGSGLELGRAGVTTLTDLTPLDALT